MNACEKCFSSRTLVATFALEDQKNIKPEDPIIIRYYCLDHLPDRFKKSR